MTTKEKLEKALETLKDIAKNYEGKASDYAAKVYKELTGSYTRPIHEPETWEGEVIALSPDCNAVCGFPPSWVGKRVIVEVCE